MWRAFQHHRLWRRLLPSLRSLRTRLSPARPARRSRSLLQTPPKMPPPATLGSRWRNATASPPARRRYWTAGGERLKKSAASGFMIFPFFISFSLNFIFFFFFLSVFTLLSLLHLSADSMSVMMCVLSAPLLPQSYILPTASPLQLSSPLSHPSQLFLPSFLSVLLTSSDIDSRFTVTLFSCNFHICLTSSFISSVCFFYTFISPFYISRGKKSLMVHLWLCELYSLSYGKALKFSKIWPFSNIILLVVVKIYY